MIDRLTKGVTATLTLDTEGGATLGACTIVVVDHLGASVVSSTAATDAGLGVYTYSLAGRSALGTLTATWTIGSTTWTTQHEVVGGRYFTIAAGQGSHNELANGGDFTSAQITAKRDVVETEIERVTGLAFTRRRCLVTVNGSDTALLQLPVRYVRRIVSASIYSTYGATTYTALTAAELAAVALDDAAPPDTCTGLITRADGSTWPFGRGNIVLDVEHGYDSPPPDVYAAALRLLFWRTVSRNTEVLDRATSFSASGGNYQLATASRFSTGIPEINAVLERYQRKATEGKARAASRPMRMSTNRTRSIFHRS